MIDATWIALQRAELKAQQDNSIGLANQAAGAMKLLDQIEALMKEPMPQPTPEPPPAE